MGNEPQLDPQAERLIEQHVRTIVTRWLKWIGLANGATLLALVGYVAFRLPDTAAERLLPRLNDRVDNLTTVLETKLGDAFVLSGNVETSYKELQTRTTTLRAEIEGLDSALAVTRQADLIGVAQVIQAIGNSGNAGDLVRRIGKVEGTIAELGQRRDGQVYTLDNPRMPRADLVECPPGTYVTGLQASKGVGGKYAVDGISELKVRCSPVK